MKAANLHIFSVTCNRFGVASFGGLSITAPPGMFGTPHLIMSANGALSSLVTTARKIRSITTALPKMRVAAPSLLADIAGQTGNEKT